VSALSWRVRGLISMFNQLYLYRQNLRQTPRQLIFVIDEQQRSNMLLSKS